MPNNDNPLEGFRILRVERGDRTVFIVEKDGKRTECAAEIPGALTPAQVTKMERMAVSAWHAQRSLERSVERLNNPLKRR